MCYRHRNIITSTRHYIDTVTRALQASFMYITTTRNASVGLIREHNRIRRKAIRLCILSPIQTKGYLQSFTCTSILAGAHPEIFPRGGVLKKNQIGVGFR